MHTSKNTGPGSTLHKQNFLHLAFVGVTLVPCLITNPRANEKFPLQFWQYWFLEGETLL